MFKLDSILVRAREIRAPKDVRLPPIPRPVWENAVGPRVAERTEPLRLERGVLHVRASSAAWANELTMLSEAIRERLRSQGIEVSSVRFSVGTISDTAGRPRKTPRVPAPANPPLPEALQQLVARIETPELRTALARAAAQTLALTQGTAQSTGPEDTGRARKPRVAAPRAEAASEDERSSRGGVARSFGAEQEQDPPDKPGMGE